MSRYSKHLIAFIIVAVSSHMTATAAPFFGNNEDIIFEAGMTEFRLREQDTDKFGLNDHPVKLDETEVRTAISALRAQIGGGFFSEEEISTVFPAQHFARLGRYITEGLASAKPEQDVTFIISGTRPLALGLKDKNFYAGRAFYKDNRLNIIVGSYDELRNTAFETQFDPGGKKKPYTYDFGSRTRNSDAIEGAVMNIAGVENKKTDKFRYDWFVIDVTTAAESFLSNENKAAPSSAEKQLQKEAALLAKQRREMRAEMARMRKEIEDMGEGKSGGASAKSIEERMATLDALLAKDLITRDEYDAKRLEILSDI